MQFGFTDDKIKSIFFVKISVTAFDCQGEIPLGDRYEEIHTEVIYSIQARIQKIFPRGSNLK